MSDRRVPLTVRTVAVLSWRMLTTGERRRVLVLAPLMAVNGVLQSLSLAALLPFIALILDPTAVEGSGYLASLYRLAGSPGFRAFAVFCSLAVFAAVALKAVFEVVYASVVNHLVASVERRLAVELLRRCLAAPYVWFLSRNSALLVKEVMGDVVMWARTGLKSILSLTSSVIALGSLTVLLIGINPIFGVCVGVVGALLTLGIVKGLRPSLRRLATEKHVASDDTFKVANDAVVGAKDVKISGRESFFVAQFSSRYHTFARTNAKLATIQPLGGRVIEIAVAGFVVVIGLYVSGHAELRAQMVSLLAIYGIGVVRMLGVAHDISERIGSLQAVVPAVQAIRRTETALDAAAETELREPAAPVGAWQRLELEDVHYRYPEGPDDALAGVTVTIERGMRIGIVGRSGSGKTTLMDVLTGLLVPSKGRVSIGGRTLDAGNAGSWRRQIGYVPQNPFIADESLRFNVALDERTHVDDDRVLAALETANFGDVMRRELPEGLDAKLGDRGVRLSGGQRQRVAIARALYREPALLILDEATSALDAESEDTVTTALRQISREMTILVVAHRLSTVRHCDRILVLDAGRVVGFDTHAHLLRDCALYRRFVELGDLALEDAEPMLAPRIG